MNDYDDIDDDDDDDDDEDDDDDDNDHHMPEASTMQFKICWIFVFFTHIVSVIFIE